MASRPARPTILDVARRAGVSLGTVSNVLNDRGNVSALRRESVEAAIATLGYVPNGLAQSLRRQRSRVVGLCMPVSSNAYFAALLEAFEDIAAAEGYELMQVLSRHDPALELRRVQALIARQVDGLIVVPASESAATFDAIAAAGLPAVLVDRASPDARFDYVTLDDRNATRIATRALLDQGHRRLMFLMRYPGLVTTRERIRGFRETVAGVPGAHAETLVRDPDEARFAAALRARLEAADRPSALIASNSDIALAILRVLRAFGLRCPEDVSLVAFDAPAWADVLDPPLALVRPPTEALAQRAWDVLQARIARRDGPRRRIVLAATLALAGSVGPAPATATSSARRRAARRRTRAAA
jgi:LacI family transcriptional regulator